MLDFTKVKVLNHPMILHKLPWIVLVVPGRAIVFTHPTIYNKEDLDGLVRVVKAVNEQEQKNVPENSLFINSVVLPVKLPHCLHTSCSRSHVVGGCSCVAVVPSAQMEDEEHSWGRP